MTENNDFGAAGTSDDDTAADAAGQGGAHVQGDYAEGDDGRAGTVDPDARVGEEGDYGRAGAAGAGERPDLSEADAAEEDRTIRGDTEGS